MGNWTAVIPGHGIHDNRAPDDADQLLAEFIEQLRQRGQTVSAVHFTSGGGKELGADGEWKGMP